MTLARVGGGLIVVAGAALTWVVALGRPGIAATGPEVTVPATLFGVGAALVSAAASRPLDARPTRIGVALLALGAFAVVLAQARENSGNPMASLTPLIVAIAAFLSGFLATGASLWRSGGTARLVGAAILVGLGLLIVGLIAGGGQVVPPLILQAGYAVTGVGAVGVGVLALDPWGRGG